MSHQELLEHMANYGLKEVEGGWTWKFDPALFDYLEMGVDQQQKFIDMRCPTALMLGEQSEDEGALLRRLYVGRERRHPAYHYSTRHLPPSDV